MREFAKAFYSSKPWKDTRAAYSASVGGLCEECLKAGRITAGEIVHHKIELSPDNIADPDVALNWGNLELVCRDCHGKIHGRGKRFEVDAAGNVLI